MGRRKATLVLNPHGGQNLAKLADMLAVLSAAGWKTTLGMKLYGGHAQELAREAAEHGDDLLIAYGGDGTLNQVVNGAMSVGYEGLVGVIPGGTANVWATEVGIPSDPIKAALTLVNSIARPVDVGHVEVTELTVPAVASTSPAGSAEDNQEKKSKKQKARGGDKVREHFLLMAGLGIDAAVLGAVSQPLKYRLGTVAVGLAAAKELPKHHPFPVELWSVAGSNQEMLWSGKALQVVIGNSRLYAGVVEMTPQATIDDGLLDICVITAGDPLTTLQQIASLLLRRSPDQVTAEYFQGARLALRVPASIPLQLDGSAVKLKDYLSPSDRQALQEAEHPTEALVTYQFDARPRALRLAIPQNHNAALFQGAAESKASREQTSEQEKRKSSQGPDSQPEDAAASQSASQDVQKYPVLLKAMLEQGQKVKVTGGASPHPEKEKALILAGTSISQKSGKVKPLAIVLDEETVLLRSSGEKMTLASAQTLKEGQEVIVGGKKKNKWGVMHAAYLLL